jgi:capsular polysaccharide biosynthesis protein
MLRKLSAALIAASMMVAPALAADTTKAPVAPAQTAMPNGATANGAMPASKTTTTVEKRHVVKHAGHKYRHHAGWSRHHKHATHVAHVRGKHVKHVARIKPAGHVDKVQAKPVTTGSETAVKAATPSRAN